MALTLLFATPVSLPLNPACRIVVCANDHQQYSAAAGAHSGSASHGIRAREAAPAGAAEAHPAYKLRYSSSHDQCISLMDMDMGWR